MNYSQLKISEVLKGLKVSSDGLPEEEALKRQQKYGFNRLPQKKPLRKIIIFFHQFKSALVYVLLAAALISFFTDEIGDMYIILAVLLINAIVGYWQEAKAQDALYKLKQMLPQQAIVKRGGDIKNIFAEDLVPGDIVLLKAGDRVTADARIITSLEVLVNESFLTGESRAIKKHDKPIKVQPKEVETFDNMIYAGSLITYGQVEAVVTDTGQNTRLGKIARLVKETEDEPTPLQRRINDLANRLVVIILSITVGVLFIGVLRTYDFIEMFKIAVALAVAAIPEALLISITVVLAIGMQRILKKGSLVRQLLAAETLGSTSVICTDKTGTLTEGSMKVVSIITSDGKYNTTKPLAASKQNSLNKLLEIALFCNDAVIENFHSAKEQWKLIGRPTDRSLLQFVLDNNIPIQKMLTSYPRLTYLPFDSANKYMATVNKIDKKRRVIYLKGAPEIILDFCKKIAKGNGQKIFTSALKKSLSGQMLKLSSEGYRVLAGAYKQIDLSGSQDVELRPGKMNGFVLAGFYIIADPLRPEAKDTVQCAETAGIKTVMITGDHAKTAQTVARNLGLEVSGHSIITGGELNNLTDNQLVNKVENINVYARVAPDDKLRIVEAWQKKGYVVAMTGDGINDTPALKKADIGIAVGSGTEVAKETAELVLLDNNFKTIVAAIREGRVIFSNVKKITLILLSSAFAEVLIVSGGLVFFGNLGRDFLLPLTAAQILWVNIVTDGLPDIALTAEPGDPNVLKYKPVNRRSPILDTPAKLFIALISTFMAIAALAGFYISSRLTGDLDYARTISFTTLGVSSLLIVFSLRDIHKPIWRKSLLDNKFLLISVLIGFLLQITALYLPFLKKAFHAVSLSVGDWLFVMTLSFMVIVFAEITKWIAPFLFNRTKL